MTGNWQRCLRFLKLYLPLIRNENDLWNVLDTAQEILRPAGDCWCVCADATQTTITIWGMVLFCLALLFSGAAIFALAKQVRGLELKVNELQLRLRAHMKGIEIE